MANNFNLNYLMFFIKSLDTKEFDKLYFLLLTFYFSIVIARVKKWFGEFKCDNQIKFK